MNFTNQTNIFQLEKDGNNPCPNQRAITRPLLFVHNYSLFLFGSILNIFAFIILIKKSLRRHSTFAYLAFLSLSNSLLSFVRFSNWMMMFYLHIRFENYLFTCRIYHFTLDFLTHFSLFTLVCVNLDRARAVRKCRPYLRNSRSTFSSVCLKEFFIGLILSSYHLHWLIKFGYEESNGPKKQTICNVDPKLADSQYGYFLAKVYPMFELVIIFCLSLLINIICTVIIVRSLRMRSAKNFLQYRSKKLDKKSPPHFPGNGRLKNSKDPKKTEKTQHCSCFRFCSHRSAQKCSRATDSLANSIDSPTQTTEFQTHSSIDIIDPQPIISTASSILNRRQRLRRTRDRHLSAMLIVLNILYFFMNLPFHFHQTFAPTFYQINEYSCVHQFTHVLLDILQQTYFSTNFFLYVLTNNRFREELYKTVRELFSRQTTTIRQQSNSVSFAPFTCQTEDNRNFKQQQRESLPTNTELIEDIETPRKTFIGPSDDQQKDLNRIGVSETL